MQFTGEITSIKSSRGKRVMTVALTQDVSLDKLDYYASKLCEFEIGQKVEVDGVEIDGVTGELVGE